MAKTQLNVSGMTCQGCVRSVEKKLSSVAGVVGVSVDLDAGQATVEHEGASLADLIAAVNGIGFQASGIA